MRYTYRQQLNDSLFLLQFRIKHIFHVPPNIDAATISHVKFMFHMKNHISILVFAGKFSFHKERLRQIGWIVESTPLEIHIPFYKSTSHEAHKSKQIDHLLFGMSKHIYLYF